MHFSLLLVLIIALAVQLASSKKMWGSRKKKEVADEIVLPSIPKTSLDVLNTRRGGARSAQRSTKKSFGSSKGGASKSTEGMEEMLNMYIKMFEDLLESDDFESTVNPDSIRAMIEQFPGASENPEVAALLNSPELSNPAMLRQAMKEGVQMVKGSLADILAMMNDPDKLADMLSQLPPEIKPVVEALQSGDMNALKDFVINMPGLERAQKKLLLGLLDGNTDLLTTDLQKVLGDKDQIEEARLQLLASPELAEAFGLPMEVLSDPKQWAAAMAQGAEALMTNTGTNAAAGEVEEEEIVDTEEFIKRRFSKLSRERAA